MAELMTFARPYAKAAFEVALANNALTQWQKMLVTASLVVTEKRVSEALASPALTWDQQSRLILQVCGEELDVKVANFVRILSENKRVTLLPEITRQFSELKSQHERIVEVNVISAFPLDVKVADSLTSALSRKWQCHVRLQTEVDKSLLGGVIINAGDTVIDASVRGRMLKLADALIA